MLRKEVNLENNNLKKLTLHKFLTANTVNFFKISDIPHEFISHHLSKWDENESFQQCRKVVKSLRVTNDYAERGVALITKHNRRITNKEEQQQYLLQVVQQHRAKYSSAAKKSFV